MDKKKHECTHVECPYKFCRWHKEHDPVKAIQNLGGIVLDPDPERCTAYLDV